MTGRTTDVVSTRVGRDVGIPSARAGNVEGVALYSTYRTYVPYSLSPIRFLKPDTVPSSLRFLSSHRYR